MTGVGALISEAGAELGSLAEARTLLAHAIGIEPSRLALVDGFDADAVANFRRLVARRRAGEPVQYLTGRVGFRTVELEVGPGVFIPRPETEVMTGWAIEQVRGLDHPVVVELCAGSGAISLAIATEMPGVTGYAVELSPSAAQFAERNLAGTAIEVRVGDMADSFPELDGKVDLVIANPPYVPLAERELVGADVIAHEPAEAVFSGADGLDALRVVAQVAVRLLRPGGVVCAEHAESHAEAVVALFARRGGLVEVVDRRDLTQRPRFVTAVRTADLAG